MYAQAEPTEFHSGFLQSNQLGVERRFEVHPKLGYTYIGLRNFVKMKKEPDTNLDKWLYVRKQLSSSKKLPTYFRKPIFRKLFSIAEYSKMLKEEQIEYDTILKGK